MNNAMINENEVWCLVPFDKNYMVSSLGRVKSIPRIVITKNGKKLRMTKEIILKPLVLQKTGYLQVMLSNRKKISVHRLVLLSFFGEPPVKMDAAHLDGNRKNCKLNNLQWKTKIDNAKDKVLHGTQRYGERLHNAKFTKEQILKIRQDMRSRVAISKDHGVTPEAISHIMLRKTWSWL